MPKPEPTKQPVRVDRNEPSARAQYKARWMPTETGTNILSRLDTLIARPDEGAPFNTILMGESGVGVSHLLDHFADRYPDLREEMPLRIQVVAAKVPERVTHAKVLRALLVALGATFTGEGAYDVLLESFVVKAEVAGVALIILDDLHSADRHARITLQVMRDISCRVRRPVVLGARLSLERLLRQDANVAGQFVCIHLADTTEARTSHLVGG